MNLKCTFLCLLAILVGSYTLSAQTTPERNCGVMEHLDYEKSQDPKREWRLNQIEKHTQNYLESAQKVDGVITIPVVVHVVYRTATENITDGQIATQMQVLNDDFRRLNADADNTWSQAADTEIQFCMASVDPNGNATNGITRTQTTVNGFGTNDGMKFNSSGGKDAWPTGDYLNMWVCNIGGGILGYAQFPGGSAATDGVVMGYQYFGTTGTAQAPFDGGRTTTHEVGHWLNLRHIWGDGACGQDDFVADTPASDAANYGCATGHVSCSSTDMVQNYMDYSDDGCMNLFTAGQTARMRALFDTGGFRASLLNSTACGAPADPTCDDGIQNGGETGVDCGGPCSNACPTCDDGIQNGDETGVDCGGSSCNVCPCNGTNVTVTINLDNYPEETSWILTDANGATVGSGGTYGSQPDGSTVTETFCLSDGCYDFVINDAYGDGICCTYGQGSYSVTDENGTSLAGGSQFTQSELTNFCIGGGATPTCDDGEQNGDETGVDCGGSSCDPCPTCNDGIQNGDETGIDCGGTNCNPCPTCNDGIQNGDETGVDCGGSDCAACPTCDDGIQNGNETGVDCGGSCSPCATCNDGMMNGDETGVDCGGSCPDACSSCNDGIQNGNETGVDCGGDCMPCSTNCTGTEVDLTIVLDNYPEETSWTLTAQNGTIVASGGTYGNQPDGSTVSESFCLEDGCYTFTINDTYGDGICCAYGQGSFDLSDVSGILVSGGQFSSSDSQNFCVGDVTPTPTCDDGIQNGNETGVDCGGDCAPCGGGSCTNTPIDFNDFESSWGIWNDGGSDCRRSTQDAAYAFSGVRPVRLRDNTSTSTTTTDPLNLSNFEELTVDFSYLPLSMENGEDFWLQISTNGGSSYTTVATWASGTDFQNGGAYQETVVIPGPFSSNTRVRFRCDASGNRDYIYLDDVSLSGCALGGYIQPDTSGEQTANAENSRQAPPTIQDGISNLNLFPNPASDRLTVTYEISKATHVQLIVTDLNGRTISLIENAVEAGSQAAKLSIDDLNSGIYLLQVISDDSRMMKKFVVVK